MKETGKSNPVRTKRVIYAILTISLIIVEVLIALYVHDSFVRPYLGDVIVVIVIYCFIRIFVPEKCHLLPLFVFIFAACVEILQMFNLVDILGLGKINFFRVLLGSVFDVKDVICYAAGCLLLGLYETVLFFREKKY